MQAAERVLLNAYNGAMGVRQALQASDTLIIPVISVIVPLVVLAVVLLAIHTANLLWSVA